jgi:hypothetical protein
MTELRLDDLSKDGQRFAAKALKRVRQLKSVPAPLMVRIFALAEPERTQIAQGIHDELAKVIRIRIPQAHLRDGAGEVLAQMRRDWALIGIHLTES